MCVPYNSEISENNLTNPLPGDEARGRRDNVGTICTGAPTKFGRAITSKIRRYF